MYHTTLGHGAVVPVCFSRTYTALPSRQIMDTFSIMNRSGHVQSILRSIIPIQYIKRGPGRVTTRLYLHRLLVVDCRQQSYYALLAHAFLIAVQAVCMTRMGICADILSMLICTDVNG